jgi:hypothetical protein
MMALLLLHLLVPRDTVLIELYLVSTNERVTVEAIQQDSTLYLPTNAVRDLLGIPPPPSPWISLGTLQQMYPTTVMRWMPAEGRVLIWDELQSLPAVKRFHEQHRATAFGTTPLPQYSGPFGAVAVDDTRRGLIDLGYLYRGRFAFASRVDDRGTAQWVLSAAPSSHVFLNYAQATHQPAQFSTRVIAGPFWLLTNYTSHKPLDAAGLLRVGPAAVFVSRAFAVLTLQADPWWSVQVAHTTTGRSLARVSWGPVSASPFSLPLTSLH